jgi:acyl-CoA synthetase (AMP-forming)/AMP-acid ligase II
MVPSMTGPAGVGHSERLPVYPSTIWQLLARAADDDPDRVLIEDDHDHSITTIEWMHRAEAVAVGLQDLGIRRDTVVSWQLPTSIDAFVLVMALSRLGAVQNPILPLLRRKEVSFIVNQTRSQLLITPNNWRNFDYASMSADVASDTGVGLLILDSDGLPEGDPADLPPLSREDGNAVRHIYYSSGSTADPKGVLHTDQSVMHAATGPILCYSITADDCIPIPFPCTHIGGMAMTIVALYTRCKLLLFDIFDAKTSPLVMSRKGGTLLGSAVPFFHAYLRAQRERGSEPLFPRVRSFVGGGAPTPPEMYYEMKELFGVSIVSSWGLTECPIASGGTLDDSDEDLAHTEGRLISGVTLRVVDIDGREVKPGEEGELRLKGPQGFKGYVDSSLNAGAFDELGFIRTGDLGIVGPRGHIKITGRIKDVIIRNAENISAQEIEDLLYEHPKVADVTVIGLPDPKTGERACAVVALAEGADSLSLAEIVDFCRQQNLTTQKIPEQLEIVDQVPRNAVGKVLKQELRSTYG